MDNLEEMDRFFKKNQYCKNDDTTKCNLQIQCNPYQITNGIFHRTRTKISQFIWKHKRPRIAKAVLRKKNEAGDESCLGYAGGFLVGSCDVGLKVE